MNGIQNYGMINFNNYHSLQNQNKAKIANESQQSQVSFKSRRLVVNGKEYIGAETSRYMKIINDFIEKAKNQIHDLKTTVTRELEDQRGYYHGTVEETKYWKEGECIRRQIEDVGSHNIRNVYYYKTPEVSVRYVKDPEETIVEIQNRKTGDIIKFQS